MQVERHFILDHLRTLFYTARHLRRSQARAAQPRRRPRQAVAAPDPRALRSERRRADQHPLPQPRSPGRYLALPAVAAPRAPAVQLAALRRPFGQDTDVDSYGGYAGQIPWFDWKYLGEKEILATVPRRALPGEVLRRRRRLRLLRQLGEAQGLRARGRLQAGAVRLRQAPDLHRQGDLLHRLQRHLRPLRAAVEGVDQPVRVPQAARSPATASSTPTTCRSPTASPWSTCSSITPRAPRCPAPSTRARQGWYFNQGEKTGLTEEFFTIAHLIESSH